MSSRTTLPPSYRESIGNLHWGNSNVFLCVYEKMWKSTNKYVPAIAVSKENLCTSKHSVILPLSTFLHKKVLRGDAAVDVTAVAASSVWQFKKITLALVQSTVEGNTHFLFYFFLWKLNSLLQKSTIFSIFQRLTETQWEYQDMPSFHYL